MVLNSISSIFAFLCVINVLTYTSRGVIPGAPVQFQAFAQQTLSVAPEKVSVYIGVLVSAFIASYSIFICVFGYLTIRHRPFLLISAGLFIWVVSQSLAGLSKPLDSFYLLVGARVLCGVGESSFQAVMPSFIDQHAPANKRTFWLGLFGCAISAGTAIGYSFGSLTAQSIGWDVGFYILGGVMLPFAFVCYRWIPSAFDLPLAYDPSTATAEMLIRALNGRSHHQTHQRPAIVSTLLSETIAILSTPLFLTSSFGLAAYVFTLAGLGAFGPVILIGSGVLSERVAATAFGGMVVLAGLIGSPLGGYLVDYQCRGRGNEADYRLFIATRQMFWLVVGGISMAFLSWMLLNVPAVCLGCMFVSLVLLFMTQSAQTVSILLSVTKQQRGFATGLSVFLCHLLGDVPSPVIVGVLKDAWAPSCGSVIDSTGLEKLNPECVVQGKDGLQRVLAFAFLWLGWAVFMWGLSYCIARKQLRRQPKSAVLFDPYSTPVLSA